MLYFVFIFLTFLLSSFDCSSEDFQITVYDVGQGHCVLANQGTNFAMLLDCGSKEKSLNNTNSNDTTTSDIIKTLRDNDYPQLVVAISHPDEDHLNLVPKIIDAALLQRIKVFLVLGGSIEKYFIEHFKDSKSRVEIKLGLGGKILEWLNDRNKANFITVIPMSHVLDKQNIKELANNAKILHERKDLSKEEKYEKIRAYFKRTFSSSENRSERNKTRGHVFNTELRRFILDRDFNIPEGIEVKILSANAGQLAKFNETQPTPILTADENANSMVIKVVKNIEEDHSFSFISPGDATGATTDRMVFESTQNPDILKTDMILGGHHGADTEESNNSLWARYVKPRYLIFSSGTMYQHPRCAAVQHYLDIEIPSITEINAGDAGHNFSCFRKISEKEELLEPFTSNLVVATRKVKESIKKLTWNNIRKNIYNTHNSGTITVTLKEGEKNPTLSVGLSSLSAPHYAISTQSSAAKKKDQSPPTSPISENGGEISRILTNSVSQPTSPYMKDTESSAKKKRDKSSVNQSSLQIVSTRLFS